MGMMSTRRSNLRRWWSDDPEDPARPAATHPDVQSLLRRIAPGERVTDLGGTMSLNLHLPASGRVVRVHQPWNTRRRVCGEQALRVALLREGWRVPQPLLLKSRSVLACGRRLAECETYVSGVQPPPTYESYRWLFHEMGRLHATLAGLDVSLPRGMAATWAPPGSLQRWLAVTEPALRASEAAGPVARRLRGVANAVRRDWVDPRDLPGHLVHGDFRLGNVVQSVDQATVVYDVGFANWRPRAHDLAYTAGFMLLALGNPPDSHDLIAQMSEEYERARRVTLTRAERQFLIVDAAAVMIHALAHDGYTADPAGSLPHRLPFLDVAESLIRGR